MRWHRSFLTDFVFVSTLRVVSAILALTRYKRIRQNPRKSSKLVHLSWAVLVADTRSLAYLESVVSGAGRSRKSVRDIDYARRRERAMLVHIGAKTFTKTSTSSAVGVSNLQKMSGRA